MTDVHTRAIIARTFHASSAFSSRATHGLCAVHCPRARMPLHAALHHPPDAHGIPPTQRGGCSACLGTLPSGSSRMCTFYLHGHRPAPSPLRPCADFDSPMRVVADSPVSRSHPAPSVQWGAGLIPADRRQQQESQLLLLLTS